MACWVLRKPGVLNHNQRNNINICQPRFLDWKNYENIKQTWENLCIKQNLSPKYSFPFNNCHLLMVLWCSFVSNRRMIVSTKNLRLGRLVGGSRFKPPIETKIYPKKKTTLKAWSMFEPNAEALPWVLSLMKQK